MIGHGHFPSCMFRICLPAGVSILRPTYGVEPLKYRAMSASVPEGFRGIQAKHGPPCGRSEKYRRCCRSSRVHPAVALRRGNANPGGFKAAVLSRLKVTRTIFGANASQCYSGVSSCKYLLLRDISAPKNSANQQQKRRCNSEWCNGQTDTCPGNLQNWLAAAIPTCRHRDGDIVQPGLRGCHAIRPATVQAGESMAGEISPAMESWLETVLERKLHDPGTSGLAVHRRPTCNRREA